MNSHNLKDSRQHCLKHSGHEEVLSSHSKMIGILQQEDANLHKRLDCHINDHIVANRNNKATMISSVIAAISAVAALLAVVVNIVK